MILTSKSENISTEDDPYEETNNTKQINYFDFNVIKNWNTIFQESTNQKQGKIKSKQHSYNLSLTQRRNIIHHWKQKLIYTPFLLDFQKIINLKKNLIISRILSNVKIEKEIEDELWNLLKDSTQLKHIPTWSIIFDILQTINISKALLLQIREISFKLSQAESPDKPILKMNWKYSKLRSAKKMNESSLSSFKDDWHLKNEHKVNVLIKNGLKQLVYLLRTRNQALFSKTKWHDSPLKLVKQWYSAFPDRK